MKIEELFVSSLGSKQKLKWFLDNDINLIVYLNARWSQIMILATTTINLIPKSKLKSEIGEIDSQRILKILKQKRYDLYHLLSTKKGLIWLDREVKNFVNYFL